MNDNGAPGFRPIDIVTLAYAAIEAILVATFMSDRWGWYFLFGFYLAACGIVLVFALFQKFGFFKILRLFYPVVLMPMLYEALNKQIFLFHRHPFDSQINALEMAVFGFDPAFAIQPHMTILLNEFMSFFYMLYYLLPFLALFLFLYKRSWDSLERGSLAVSVAFYISYIIFLLYPVVGPRHYLESIYYLPVIGPYFTPLVHKIVGDGGLYGGAMPSSHCAVALVFVWFICRESKTLRLPLAVALTMICLSTVYGRYHYISDVVAGLAIGFVSILLTSRWQNSFLRAKERIALKPGVESNEAIEIET
jgi:membrane-associated phospholipid phosphatase